MTITSLAYKPSTLEAFNTFLGIFQTPAGAPFALSNINSYWADKGSSIAQNDLIALALGLSGVGTSTTNSILPFAQKTAEAAEGVSKLLGRLGAGISALSAINDLTKLVREYDTNNGKVSEGDMYALLGDTAAVVLWALSLSAAPAVATVLTVSGIAIGAIAAYKGMTDTDSVDLKAKYSEICDLMGDLFSRANVALYNAEVDSFLAYDPANGASMADVTALTDDLLSSVGFTREGSEKIHIYRYAAGGGDVVISAADAQDSLALQGLSLAQTTIYRTHNDLVLEFSGSGGSITINDWFAGPQKFGSISFADGTLDNAVISARSWTAHIGSEWADWVYSSNDGHTQLFWGRQGNDYLALDAGANVVRFDQGDGADTVVAAGDSVIQMRSQAPVYASVSQYGELTIGYSGTADRMSISNLEHARSLSVSHGGQNFSVFGRVDAGTYSTIDVFGTDGSKYIKTTAIDGTQQTDYFSFDGSHSLTITKGEQGYRYSINQSGDYVKQAWNNTGTYTQYSNPINSYGPIETAYLNSGATFNHYLQSGGDAYYLNYNSGAREWYVTSDYYKVYYGKSDAAGNIWQYTLDYSGNQSYSYNAFGYASNIDLHADGSAQQFDWSWTQGVDAVLQWNTDGKLTMWGSGPHNGWPWDYRDTSVLNIPEPTIPTIDLSKDFLDLKQNFAKFLQAPDSKPLLAVA